MNDLELLTQDWLEMKEVERQASETRRIIEDRLLSLIGIAENLEGTENASTENGYQIKVVGRMNRKVDADLLQELAVENGLSDHLSSLFRWKPDINLSAWKSTDSSITNKLLPAITTTPGRPSFTITLKDK